MPKLYEINTEVFLNQLGNNTRLSSIPKIFFKDLADKGITAVWLMGMWKTSNNLVEKYCFTPDLISEYDRAMPGWKKEDITGSPYAIEDYSVNPDFGSREDLISLHEYLNSIGLKLFLDFIPNHFGADTKYLKENPEYFICGDQSRLSADSSTFYKSPYDDSKIFAHGKDPFFPAWKDTSQINYFEPAARTFMINNLLNVAGLCDGVRCDMAMLVLNHVFENNWGNTVPHQNNFSNLPEFWSEAITKVKNKFPDFIFLAESYWDLEWQLQQLGFDYTYDKRLTDRLASNNIDSIKSHLMADKSFSQKSMRFLENHDEPRAVVKFGIDRSLAAAVITSTIEGMKFYFDGQFEGSSIKLPVQLKRKPIEPVNQKVKNYYDKILSATKEKIFIEGSWKMLNPISAGGNDQSFNNIFAWQWKLNNQISIVAVNYSDSVSYCRLKFDIPAEKSEIKLVDMITDTAYMRSISEIYTQGLFIELQGFQSHIFSL